MAVKKKIVKAKTIKKAAPVKKVTKPRLTAPVVKEEKSKKVAAKVEATLKESLPKKGDKNEKVVGLKPSLPLQEESSIEGVAKKTPFEKANPPKPIVHPGADYLTECFFDRKNKRYVARVVEISGVEAFGRSRSQALEELEMLLEDHVAIARKRGDTLPLPLREKEYPETLEINLSQKLFRMLDTLSKRERISVDKLVTEIVTSGTEKRFEPAAKTRSAHSGGGNNHHAGGGPRQNGGNRHQNRGNRSNGNRNFNNFRDGNTHQVQPKENFMEYVRSLEKNHNGNNGNYR